VRAAIGRSEWADLGELWDRHEIPLLRLAGNGGAALFMRAHVTPAPETSPVAARLSVDIGVMGPDFRHFVLGRPADVTLPGKLHEFFLSAATEDYPELTLPSFQDVAAGVSISVVESDGKQIAFDVKIADDIEAANTDFLELNFEVSRASLVSAAQAAGRLAVFQSPTSVFGSMRNDWAWFWDHGDEAGEPGAIGSSPLLHSMFPLPEGSRMTGVWTKNPLADDPMDIVLFAFVDLGEDQDPATESDFLTSHLPNCIGGFYGVYPGGEPWLVVILKGAMNLVHEFEADIVAEGEMALVDGLMRAMHFNYDAGLAYAEHGGPGILRGQGAGGDCFWSLTDLHLAYRMRGVPDEPIAEWTATQLVWGLLAETCNMPLTQVAAGHAGGCAFPNDEHACEHDVFGDVFVAWTEGTLRKPESDDPTPPDAGDSVSRALREALGRIHYSGEEQFRADDGDSPELTEDELWTFSMGELKSLAGLLGHNEGGLADYAKDDLIELILGDKIDEESSNAAANDHSQNGDLDDQQLFYVALLANEIDMPIKKFRKRLGKLSRQELLTAASFKGWVGRKSEGMKKKELIAFMVESVYASRH